MRYFTRNTRDYTQVVNMGPLVVRTFDGKPDTVVSPARTQVTHHKAGMISPWHAKGPLRAYLAAINAEHPGAVEQCDQEGQPCNTL